MEIAVRVFHGKHILDVSGELDLYNAHHLRESFKALVARGGRGFVLNLKGVRFIDSSGVAALLSVNAMLAVGGGPLRICNVSAPVRRVLELTGLNGFLPMAASELDALESIGSPSERAPAPGSSGAGAASA